MSKFEFEYFDQANNPDGYGGYKGEVAEGGIAFPELAANIVALSNNPITAYDFGAAKGFLVRELAKLGIDCRGFDISEYACEMSMGLVKRMDICDLPASVENDQFDPVDLIVCIGVLAYVPEDKVLPILKAFRQIGEYLYFYATTEEDLAKMVADGKTDSRVVIRRPAAWWSSRLVAAGWRWSDGLMWRRNFYEKN